MTFQKARLAVATGLVASFIAPMSVEAATYVTHRNGHQYVVHKRSTKKSAAIVGGSALGGAAIGALAGGGKGAGIGALVGGAGGFIYDRKTHKKVYRQY